MDQIQKSESIKAGLRKGFQDGNSKMAQRRCYGYDIAPGGQLVINPNEAAKDLPHARCSDKIGSDMVFRGHRGWYNSERATTTDGISDTVSA